MSRGSAGEYQADERQVWRGSAGEYQADERAGVARLTGPLMGLLLSISVMSPPSLWHILLYSLSSCSKYVILVVFSSKRTCLSFSRAHMTPKMFDGGEKIP